MTAHRPPIATLTGAQITLEPLTDDLLPQLYSAIGHPQVFAGGYGGGPAGLRDTVDEFVEWAHGYYLSGSGNPYAVMLLGLAFDSGFGRVKIQADAANERSRAAIAGIGAAFEGVLRRDKIRADGTWRDTAVYSVIVDEWPVVRAHLEQRLQRFEGRPVLFRTA